MLRAVAKAVGRHHGHHVGPNRANQAHEVADRLVGAPLRERFFRAERIAEIHRAREILLCAVEPGAAMTLEFKGTAIGAYLLAGPDAGIAEFAVDDGPFTRVDLFHPFSRGLHYPRTVMFAADLKPGLHTLKLRIADPRNKDSSCHACRIVHLVAN